MIRPLQRVLHATALFLLVGLAACGQEPAVHDYVARVGDQQLSREELRAALQSLPAGLDSTEARRQILEQWVTNALLYQEATRRNLRDDAQVQRLLTENERSVLVSALLTELYEESPATPTQAELETYYERNKEQLLLREPFVRVRYLATRTADSAATVRAQLQRMSGADSLWADLVERYADDPAGSLDLARNYYAESRLFSGWPSLRDALNGLESGNIAPVVSTDSLYHVLQLVERVPAGAIPELAWVEDELRQRLTVQARKQIYARQVQRLRNEALAREELDVEEPEDLQ